MIGDPARRRTVLIHEFVNGGGLAGSERPGSWAAEGAAMRRALARDFAACAGIDVILTRDDRLDGEPGPWRSFPIGPGEEPAAFARLAASADLTVAIAPETGGLLHDRATIIERAGGRSLGSSPEAIRWAGNKYALYRLWLEHGIRTPPTRPIRPRDPWPVPLTFPRPSQPQRGPRRIGDYNVELIEFHDPFPVVLKPVDGAGSVDTFYLPTTGSPIPGEAARSEVALLQPFVAGTPLSASFLVDRRGRAALACVARQRIAIREGRIAYEGGALPVDPGQCDANVRGALAVVAGLRGWVGVDFIRDEETGRSCVLEINPRPTTTIVGLLGLLPPGALAGAWLAALEGDGEPMDLAGAIPAGRSLRFAADGTIRDDEAIAPEPKRT